MSYIYLYSAVNKVDMREFTSPLILLMVTGEDDKYCSEVAWGHFSLASGGARGASKRAPSTRTGPITMV